MRRPTANQGAVRQGIEFRHCWYFSASLLLPRRQQELEEWTPFAMLDAKILAGYTRRRSPRL
jgi:hypothetical protein